jgi:hypothetical protein
MSYECPTCGRSAYGLFDYEVEGCAHCLAARLAEAERLLADSMWRVNPELDKAYRLAVSEFLGPDTADSPNSPARSR